MVGKLRSWLVVGPVLTGLGVWICCLAAAGDPQHPIAPTAAGSQVGIWGFGDVGLEIPKSLDPSIPAVSATHSEPEKIRLCQALGPAAPCNICGVDCSRGGPCRGWESARAIAWQAYAQGEYVGHHRTAHVAEYRLRVDDELDLIYRLTREETAAPYRLNVGDQIRVESLTHDALNRDLCIQPDGNITLRLRDQIHAAGP